ncbi:MAG: hydroxymethylbilane synthase [Planctomycetota bacterium]
MPETNLLRIATRESPLALWQANHVANLLRERGVPTTIVPLVSGGDVDMRPIDGTRQVGVFTKRIQQALADQEGDVAVHSLKDLPTEPDGRFELIAVPGRETVVDSLVSPNRYTIDSLPLGAKIGTGSRRRAAQLLSIRPDLAILPIRGNVQTRLQKLESGEYDAIILAEAGLQRLEMEALQRSTLPLDQMLPAPGQGALGIEVRSDDDRAKEVVGQINDRESEACVTAERGVLSRLHGGCLAPIAAHAHCQNGSLQLSVSVLSPDGKQRLDQSAELEVGSDSDLIDLSAVQQFADRISEQLLSMGAMEVIRSGRMS